MQLVTSNNGSRGEGLPVRLVSRLATEYGLMNLRQSLQLVPGRLEASIVAQALIRCALPLLIGPDGLTLPADEPLIGSISSIARSFHRPPETIRRHVHILARRGFFSVERDGVRLKPTAAASERILAYLRSIHDSMLWLVAELDSWDLVKRRASRPGVNPLLEPVLRTALDLRLVGFETFRGPIGGWTSMSLWNALSGASVRHITTNRSLSRRFMWRSTPDELRHPISVRALCAVSGLPYATVWRHLAALEESGRVGRHTDGYVMLTGQLLTKDMEERVVHFVRDMLGRVERLLAEGLNPGAVPSLFLGPKPELVPIR